MIKQAILTSLGLALGVASWAGGGRASIEPVNGLPTLMVDRQPIAPLGAAMIRVWLDPSLTGPMLGETLRASDAGIHLHVIEPARRGLPWPETYRPQEYQYVDRLFDGILTRDPEALILLRVDVTWMPKEWLDAHPDDVARDSNGESLGWPSFGSRAWLEGWREKVSVTKRGKESEVDSEKLLELVKAGKIKPPKIEVIEAQRDGVLRQIEMLCRHIEDAPYSNRVIGFVVDGMWLGQWHYQSARAGDYSPAGVADWRRWLTERYGGDKGLREGWRDPGASLSLAAPPPPSEAAGEGLGSHLLDMSRPASRKLVDYRTFLSERTAQTADLLCGRFKAASGGLLVGLDYGQTLDLAPAEDAPSLGHLRLSNLLGSRNVDFFVSPLSSDGREPRGFGPHTSIPLEAVREAGKLLFIEDDLRTHLSSPGPLRYAETMEDSLQLIRRDVGRALTGGVGHWLSDPEGKGWFDTQEMWGVIQTMRKIYDKASLSAGFSPLPEVAVVIDEESMLRLAPGADLSLPLLSDQRNDFARSGISSGEYLLQRIEDVPRTVKIFFFLNAFSVPPGDRARLHDFLAKRKAIAVWLFAPGIAQPGGFDSNAASALTGIKLGSSPAPADHGLKFPPGARHPMLQYVPEMPGEPLSPLGPTVFALPGADGEQAFGVYAEQPDLVALASRQMPGGWTSIFCASPRPGAGLIRGLSQAAGAHVWTSNWNVALHPAGDFLDVHCAESDDVEIRLPRRAPWAFDILNGDRIPTSGGDNQTLSTSLEAGRSYLFYFPPAAGPEGQAPAR